MLVASPDSTAPLPPERLFRASSSGSLLEFLQPRSHDRGASVSSSFPSSDAGRSPVALMKCAQNPRPPAVETPMSYCRREQLGGGAMQRARTVPDTIRYFSA